MLDSALAADERMNVYYCDSFALPLPEGHRFPMAKYRLLRERLEAQAEAYDLQLKLPPAASDEDLLRVHCPAYVERVRSGTLSDREQRKLGFPWSAAMAERTRRVSGATCAALLDALVDGIAVNLAGGTHHADYDQGAGYCVFNDSVVAARHVQALGRVERVLIVDLDVHQGDGTAALTARDPSIYSFSMHGARNYPAVKPASNLDVALPDGTADDEYLEHLRQALPRAIAESSADCAIYLAGADPFEGDRLGYLKLTRAGLKARDQYVLDTLGQAGLPVAITMAGGYASNIEDIVDIHYTTVTFAARLLQQRRALAVRAPLFACTRTLD